MENYNKTKVKSKVLEITISQQIQAISETERLWIIMLEQNEGWPVLNYNYIIQLFIFAN